MTDIKFFGPMQPRWSFLVFGIVFLFSAWMEFAHRKEIDPDRFMPEVIKNLSPEQRELVWEQSKKGSGAWLAESADPRSPQNVAARAQMESITNRIYFFLGLSGLLFLTSGYLFWREVKNGSQGGRSSDFPP